MTLSSGEERSYLPLSDFRKLFRPLESSFPLKCNYSAVLKLDIVEAHHFDIFIAFVWNNVEAASLLMRMVSGVKAGRRS